MIQYHGEDQAKRPQIKPHLSIHTLAGIVELDLFAIIQHVPTYWVCHSLFGKSFNQDLGPSNICYFYDDLKGHALLSKLDLSDIKSSGLVYLKSFEMRNAFIRTCCGYYFVTMFHMTSYHPNTTIMVMARAQPDQTLLMMLCSYHVIGLGVPVLSCRAVPCGVLL